MKVYTDQAEQSQNRKDFNAQCAILGTPRAMEAQASGSMPELQESRNAVRQMVNKLVARQADREPTTEEAGALAHASTLIAKIDNLIDGLRDTQAKAPQMRGAQVMRNQADFEKRYSGGGLASEMSMSDLFRGIAGLGSIESVKNALSEGTNTTGGYTVPDVLMPQILGALAPNSALLQAGMGVVDLSEKGAKTFTTAAINALPTAAWRAENGAVSESDPTFRAVVAAPKSLAFLFKVSRELLADSANIDEALLLAIGQAFAKELDRAGLRGSGTSPEPRGLLNTAGVQQITNGANGAALASWSPLWDALQAIRQADGPMPTGLIMSPRSYFKLQRLTATDGQYITQPLLFDAIKQCDTSQIPNNLTVGTSTDCTEIYAGDFRNMLLMLREGVSVQRADQLFAGTGQVGFVCHVRADFSVLYPAAFAVITGLRA